jgi:hypothetical protein
MKDAEDKQNGQQSATKWQHPGKSDGSWNMPGDKEENSKSTHEEQADFHIQKVFQKEGYHLLLYAEDIEWKSDQIRQEECIDHSSDAHQQP